MITTGEVRECDTGSTQESSNMLFFQLRKVTPSSEYMGIYYGIDFVSICNSL